MVELLSEDLSRDREVVIASRRTAHVPSLDGLRGVAILGVLILHFYQRTWFDEHSVLALAAARIAGFGRYGVQLFFVLSGFLITGILLDTRREPKALHKFYMRRFLRIFPLYYGSLVAVLWVLPHFVAFDEGARKILAGQRWLWTYLLNFPKVELGGVTSNIFLINHFWSLCVEEHFYIFWPFAVFLLPRKKLFGLCLLLPCVGFLCRLVAVILHAEDTSIWTWSTLQRIDGLAIGSLIAVSLRSTRLREILPVDRSFRISFATLGFFCLVLMWLPKRWNVPIVGVFSETVVVLFCGFLLLYTLRLRSDEPWQRIFSSDALMSLGKYSYGLYVIHFMLLPWFSKTFDFMALSKGRLPPLACLLCYYVVTIGLSFGLAYVSFHLYEKRWLALKRHFEYGAKDELVSR